MVSIKIRLVTYLLALLIGTLNFSDLNAAARCYTTDPYCVASGEINIINEGYGYFQHPNSRNLDLFNFGCNRRDKKEQNKRACKRCKKKKGPTNLMINVTYPLLLKKVRVALFQKALLDLRVINPKATSKSVDVPSCLQERKVVEGKVKRVPVEGAYRALKYLDKMGPFGEGERYKWSLKTYKRSDEMTSQFSEGYLIKKLYHYDRLMNFKKRKCGSNKFCSSVKRTIQKIMANNPILFPKRNYQEIRDKRYPGKKMRAKFRSAVQQALGTMGLPGTDMDDIKHTRRGKSWYEKNLKGHHFRAPVAFNVRLEKISKKYSPHANISPPTNTVWAYKTLQKVGKELRQAHLKRYAIQYASKTTAKKLNMEKICQKGILFNVERNYPNVFRQLLADMTPAMRNGTRYLMCQWNILKKFRRPKCQGVKVGKKRSDPIKIESYAPDYPFGSDNKYTIYPSENPSMSKPHKIVKTIYVRDKSRMSARKFKEIMKKRGEALSAWYTKEARRLKRPVKFEFKIKKIWNPFKVDNVFDIYDCYNHDLKSSNCKKISNYKVAKCRKEYQRSGQSKSYIRENCKKFKKVGAEINDREDAGHLTTKTTDRSWRHETAHQLGIDDEYQDKNIAYTSKARLTEGSLMGSGNKLLKRHIDQFLGPLSCYNP